MPGTAGSKYGIKGDGVPVAKGKVMEKLETLKSILDKQYIVTMPDGSRWAIPVRVIAENRADFHADEFGGDAFISMAEDTAPFFEENGQAVIENWAKNQMKWYDVGYCAVQLSFGKNGFDFEQGWENGEVEIK